MIEKYMISYLKMGEWNYIQNLDNYETGVVSSALIRQSDIDEIKITRQEEEYKL